MTGHRYIVKVGNRTSEWPDKTKRFHKAGRAYIHASRMRDDGYPARVYPIKPEDRVFTNVPFADQPPQEPATQAA